VVLVVALVVAAMHGAPASAAEPRAVPGTGGLTIAPGSRLLGGTAFPVLVRRHLAGADGGWTATFEVTGPGASVYDAYAAQGRARGYDLPWSDHACTNPTGAMLSCSSDATSGQGRFEITVNVCAQCAAPVASATVQELVSPPLAPAVPGEPPSERNPALELALDTSQLDAARASRPTVGHPLGSDTRMTLVPGSTAVTGSSLLTCGAPIMLRATGNVDEVYRRYVAQLPRESARVAKAQGTVNGRRARQTVTDFGSVQMVEFDDGARIALNECPD
jgi:hypothetical protein